jgi:hypothetical protein
LPMFPIHMLSYIFQEYVSSLNANKMYSLFMGLF